jgi:hypothetical protein
MERQRATTQVAHYDDFSKALIESAVRHLGEEGIPSLQKKGNEDDFSKKDPKAKAAPADPAINIAGGTGTKQSHGAEIEYTTVRSKNVQREEAELMPGELVGTTYEAVLETGESIILEKEKGLDGKACWKGYKLAGTKKKGGKTVDNCVKEEDESKAEEEKEKKMSKSAKEKHEKAEDKAEKKAEMKEEKGGADKKSETKFHTKLDKLVHKTFGKSPDEKKMKEEVSLQDIVEKAVSKSQQKFMGMVHAKKKGEMTDGSEKVDKAAASLTSKEAEKFASTKHKGLPEKKAQKEEFELTEKKLDAVGKEDKDIDNDGDHDKSDKYLLNRRKKVGKILSAKKKVDEMIAIRQEMINEKKQ